MFDRVSLIEFWEGSFMTKFLKIVITILLSISTAATPVLGQETHKIHDQLDYLLYSMVGPDKAKGAVLSIVKDGQIQLCKGFGFADEYNNITADGKKTAFRIGSVSKTFVAVAAQILHQDGKLDMNRDISTYLEADFPTFSYPVTMQQLLTYTAGFEETITGMAVFNVSDTEPLSESVRKYMPVQTFKPGEVVSYSNYGIALAAYVIESIAKQDFAEYCREHIFLPLDMKRTTFEYMHNIAYVSKPYLPNGKETLEPYMNLYPEGSAVSTADDMAKYMQWLLNMQDTRVLSAGSKKELFSKHFSMTEELEGVGYTWNRKARNSKLYYTKKGETLHFYTRIVLYPQAKTGIFLSFNTYLPEQEINAVMEKATDLLYGKATPSSFHSAKLTMDISGQYVNNWSSYKTPEKILRYLVPGKILTISKTREGNFLLNGKEMILIGENLFSSPIGLLKFQEQSGKTLIATESAITYSRIPFWEYNAIQMLIPLLFIALALICLLKELMLFVRKKRNEYRVVYFLSTLTQLLSFFTLCLLMYKGITSYSPLAFSFPIMICGWIFLAACSIGIAYTIYLKSKKLPIKLISVGWHIAGILLCLWMFGLNIL